MAEVAQHGRLPWLPVPHRIALMFASMFFITGTATPFLPVWLEARGLAADEIGWLSFAALVVRGVTTPIVGWYADRQHAHRALIIALSALGLLAWLMLWGTSGLGWAFAAMALIALGNTMQPLVESVALAGVRRAGHDYGRMRTWGSAAFVVANLLSGWLANRAGIEPVISLIALGAAATLAASVLLPAPDPSDPALTARGSLTWRSAMAVLGVPLMPALLLAAAALQGSHGMYYAYGSLHWKALGLDPAWFGALFAVGLITEIALFWWSARALAWLGAPGLLIAGGALAVLRWSWMAYDPPLVVLLPLQVLHGLTFGCAHLGAMQLLLKIVPPEKSATAQGLYALVSTAGVALATAMSARLYPVAGGAAYGAMAVMAAIGLLVAIKIARAARV